MSSEKFPAQRNVSQSPHTRSCTCIFGSRFFCCCDYHQTPTHLYYTLHTAMALKEELGISNFIYRQKTTSSNTYAWTLDNLFRTSPRQMSSIDAPLGLKMHIFFYHQNWDAANHHYHSPAWNSSTQLTIYMPSGLLGGHLTYTWPVVDLKKKKELTFYQHMLTNGQSRLCIINVLRCDKVNNVRLTIEVSK